MIKRLIEYIPLLTIVLLYFGYVHLYYYYASFGIDIYAYITNSEILLSFIPTIIIVLLMSLGAPFSYALRLIFKAMKGESEGRQNVLDKKKVQWRYTMELAAILFINSMGYAAIYKFHNNLYEWKFTLVVLNFLLALALMKLIKSYEDERLAEKYKHFYFAAMALCIGINIGFYRNLSAEEIKSIGNSKTISFKYNGNLIKTDVLKTLVGETQSYIFLYDRTNKNTIILNREEIDSVIVNNPPMHALLPALIP